MTNPMTPHRLPPSPWAVALFIACSAFAAISMALFSTNYRPL